MELRGVLAKETGMVGSYDDYAVSLYKIACICSDRSEQLKYLQQAYDIWSRLAELCPNQPSFAQRRDIVRKYM